MVYLVIYLYILSCLYIFPYTKNYHHGLLSIHAFTIDHASNCLAFFVKNFPHGQISPFYVFTFGEPFVQCCQHLYCRDYMVDSLLL